MTSAALGAQMQTPNPAVNRTLRDEAAPRRLLLRWAAL